MVSTRAQKKSKAQHKAKRKSDRDVLSDSDWSYHGSFEEEEEEEEKQDEDSVDNLKIFGGRSVLELLEGKSIDWTAFHTTIFRHGLNSGYAKHFLPTPNQLLALATELDVPFWAGRDIVKVILERLISVIDRLICQEGAPGLIVRTPTGESASSYQIDVSEGLLQYVNHGDFQYSLIKTKARKFRELHAQFDNTFRTLPGSGQLGNNLRMTATKLVGATLNRLQVSGLMKRATRREVRQKMREKMEAEDKKMEAARKSFASPEPKLPKLHSPMAPTKKASKKTTKVVPASTEDFSEEEAQWRRATPLQPKKKVTKVVELSVDTGDEEGSVPLAKPKKSPKHVSRVIEPPSDADSDAASYLVTPTPSKKPVTPSTKAVMSSKKAITSSKKAAKVVQNSTHDSSDDEPVEKVAKEKPKDDMALRCARLRDMMRQCGCSEKEITRSVAKLCADAQETMSVSSSSLVGKEQQYAAKARLPSPPSSDEVSSEEEEEEKEKREKVTAKCKVKGGKLKPGKKQVAGNSSHGDSSEEEKLKPKVKTPVKVKDVKQKLGRKHSVVEVTDEDSSSEEIPKTNTKRSVKVKSKKMSVVQVDDGDSSSGEKSKTPAKVKSKKQPVVESAGGDSSSKEKPRTKTKRSVKVKSKEQSVVEVDDGDSSSEEKSKTPAKVKSKKQSVVESAGGDSSSEEKLGPNAKKSANAQSKKQPVDESADDDSSSEEKPQKRTKTLAKSMAKAEAKEKPGKKQSVAIME